MIIANLECLTKCQTFAKHFPLLDSVSSLHSPTHPPLTGKLWCRDWNQNLSTWLTRVYTKLLTPTWLAERSTTASVSGPLLALPWLGMVLPSPLLSALLREPVVQNGAQPVLKPDAEEFTALPSVSSHPSSGPLTSCFSGPVPLFILSHCS